MVSAGGSIVIAFSMTGDVIPSGCGTLLELDLEGEGTGLSGIIMAGGIAVGIFYSNPVPAGPTVTVYKTPT